MSSESYPGAIPPPPGVIPNLDAPAGSVAKVSYAVTTIELVFPTLALIVRLYVRPFVIEKWTRVDSIFILAWVLLVANVSIGYTFPRYGQGKDAWNVSPQDYSKFLYFENTQQAIYEFAVLFSKTALLLQLEELFAPKVVNLSGRRRFIWTMIVLNAIFFIIEAFLRIFECSPRQKIWEPSIPGKCLDVEKAFISTSAVNVLEDFIILALPVVWVSHMKLSLRRKISIAAVFGVGIFVCVCSIMRLVGSIQSVGKTDLTIALVPVALWAQGEEAAALTVTALPLLPRLVKHIRGTDNPTSAASRKSKTFTTDRSLSTWRKSRNTVGISNYGHEFTSIGSADTVHEPVHEPVGSNTPTESEQTADPHGIIKTVDIHQYTSG